MLPSTPGSFHSETKLKNLDVGLYYGIPLLKSATLDTINHIRLAEKNNSTRRRRIWVRQQGAFRRCIFGICTGGCNAVGGGKDKQDGGIIFFRQP
jgi:hypothetical protein